MRRLILPLCTVFLFCTHNSSGASYLMPKTTSTSYTVVTGDYFYDSGGSADTYSSSESGTVTFNCAAGSCLQLDFYLFHVQEGNDFLYVYDGPDATYPLIGTFTRIGSPGTITATLGSLTFKFTSTTSTQKEGWGATISVVTCVTTYDIKTNNGQTLSVCSGVFYDSGKGTGSYGINESYTTTFSSNAGNCLQAILYSPSGTTFPSTAIASGDTLKVYDGTSISSTLIGKYAGSSKTPGQRWLSSSGSLTFKFTSNGTNNGTGWIIGLSCTTCPSTIGSQTVYLQPTSGLQNSGAGANMVNTCSGIVTDDGGLSSNYSQGICTNCAYGYYRSFCPATAGTCLRINFYEIRIASGTSPKDNFVVINGPTQYNTPFQGGNNISGVTCTSYDDCMGQQRGPWISTDPSGCITTLFRSNSDGVTETGWKATLDCIPCTYGPNGTDNNDCVNATELCDDASINESSTGPGLISDTDPSTSCVVSENFTSWYYINIETGGTIGFTLTPYKTGVTGDDFDFALYGPATDCNSKGSAVRCSYAWTNVSGNPTNTTGMNTATNASFNDGSSVCGTTNSGSDVSEDVCGNSWTNELDVLAGETYYLMINRWTSGLQGGGDGYSLDFSLTNGASIGCVVLPVQLTNFTCEANPGFVALDWTTASEKNNDHFLVEKSTDGENYFYLTTMPGKGTTSMPSEYFMTDNHPVAGTNYYRLSQVDKNGASQQLKVSSCEYADANENVTLQVFDMSGALLLRAEIAAGDFENYMHDASLPNGVYVTSLQHGNGMIDLGKYLKLR